MTLPITIGVAIMGAAARRRVLTFDLARGVCAVENAGRVILRAPLSAVHGIAIRVLAPPSETSRFEVLVAFERARMRIAQADEEEATRLARWLCERTGLRPRE